MEDLIQTNYALDTFYFLMMGVLVMFMAPGFAMLEAGMVRAKNTSEILSRSHHGVKWRLGGPSINHSRTACR